MSGCGKQQRAEKQEAMHEIPGEWLRELRAMKPILPTRKLSRQAFHAHSNVLSLRLGEEAMRESPP